MRILVVGAGAVGGYFGAKLLKAGRDVTFLVRPRRAALLAEFGLAIKSPLGDFTLPNPPIVLSPDIREPFDLVFLSCKAYDLDDAMASFAPAVGPDTVIMPMLNGMRHLDALDARFAKSQVLGGKCHISSTLDETGTVLHLSKLQSIFFGERDGGLSPRVEAIQAQLDGAGFESVASDDIMQEMWEKWMFLAALAAITSLMRAPVGPILAAPDGQKLALQMLVDCVAISSANGHPPRAAYAEQITKYLTTTGSPMTASMMRDIGNHSRIEADHVVGDLLARQGSAPDPALLKVAYCHLKAYESVRVLADA